MGRLVVTNPSPWKSPTTNMEVKHEFRAFFTVFCRGDPDTHPHAPYRLLVLVAAKYDRVNTRACLEVVVKLTAIYDDQGTSHAPGNHPNVSTAGLVQRGQHSEISNRAPLQPCRTRRLQYQVHASSRPPAKQRLQVKCLVPEPPMAVCGMFAAAMETKNSRHKKASPGSVGNACLSLNHSRLRA